MKTITPILLITITLFALLSISIVNTNVHEEAYEGANIYENTYFTKVEVYNLYNMLVGVAQVSIIVTFNVQQQRITGANSGTTGCLYAAPLWSCTWGNPWWDVRTDPGNSRAVAKIWQKISSPIWSEEGDIWVDVRYYGGSNVYYYSYFIGRWGYTDFNGVADYIVSILITIFGVIWR